MENLKRWLGFSGQPEDRLTRIESKVAAVERATTSLVADLDEIQRLLKESRK